MEDKKLPKLKIGMLGDVNAGKTSFIHRFISGGFEENLVPTVGMEGQSKEVTVENRPFSALIFDTAGKCKVVVICCRTRKIWDCNSQFVSGHLWRNNFV